ncbi:putative olfactory receptor 7A2 [Ictidomys tridecemlineatus]
MHLVPGNHTQRLEFLLLGLAENPELQPFLFDLFLFMYLVIVLGNLLIILAVISDSHLHTCMYFFLSNLSFVDTCFTSTTIPKMLLNIQTQSKAISYADLKIPHFFCELNQVVQRACSDTFLNEVVIYFAALLLAGGTLVGLLYSYCKIVFSIRAISSAQDKHKAFSTCASHLSVVSLFYGTSLGVVTQNLHSIATASVMYTVVTPMLNPFIYSLRNKDIKSALRRLCEKH